MAKIELNSRREWLMRNAAEDESGSVSAGGLAHQLGLLEPSFDAKWAAKSAFAKLIELRRRERGLSLEVLSAKTGIALASLIAIEEDADATLQPSHIALIAKVIDLPEARLMQLAGLSETQDEKLERAAVRFAARSKPSERLSPYEHKALAELVKMICET